MDLGLVAPRGHNSYIGLPTAVSVGVESSTDQSRFRCHMQRYNWSPSQLGCHGISALDFYMGCLHFFVLLILKKKNKKTKNFTYSWQGTLLECSFQCLNTDLPMHLFAYTGMHGHSQSFASSTMQNHAVMTWNNGEYWIGRHVDLHI